MLYILEYDLINENKSVISDEKVRAEYDSMDALNQSKIALEASSSTIKPTNFQILIQMTLDEYYTLLHMATPFQTKAEKEKEIEMITKEFNKVI